MDGRADIPVATTAFQTCKVFHCPHDTLCLLTNVVWQRPDALIHCRYVVLRSQVILNNNQLATLHPLQLHPLTMEIVGVDFSTIADFGLFMHHLHDSVASGFKLIEKDASTANVIKAPMMPVIALHCTVDGSAQHSTAPALMQTIMLNYLDVHRGDLETHVRVSTTLRPINTSQLNVYLNECIDFIQDNAVVLVDTATYSTRIEPLLKKRLSIGDLVDWLITWLHQHSNTVSKNLYAIHALLTMSNSTCHFFSSVVFKKTSVQADAQALHVQNTPALADKFNFIFGKIAPLMNKYTPTPFLSTFTSTLAAKLVTNLLVDLRFSQSKITKNSSYLTTMLVGEFNKLENISFTTPPS